MRKKTNYAVVDFLFQVLFDCVGLSLMQSNPTTFRLHSAEVVPDLVPNFSIWSMSGVGAFPKSPHHDF